MTQHSHIMIHRYQLPASTLPQGVCVQLCVVPDADALIDTDMDAFLTVRRWFDMDNTPAAAAALLKEFYQEWLPFYLQIEVQYYTQAGLKQKIILCEKQPGYDVSDWLKFLLSQKEN